MRKVTIIGAGPGNPDLLSRAALDAIDIADVVIGAHRALAGIDVPPDVVRCELVKTADIVAALTDAASWQRAVVVMTGDVGLFSGARRLVEALSGDAQVDVRVIPGISSASYLAARLARPWQDWRFASAHGVACDIVAEAERAGELFLVTSGGEDPSRLSGELVQAGRAPVVPRRAHHLRDRKWNRRSDVRRLERDAYRFRRRRRVACGL